MAVAEGVVDADEEHEIYNDFEKNWRSTATFSKSDSNIHYFP